MSGFTKLFSTIVGSTIWREPPHIRVVWITMLAVADQEGYVGASVPGLADLARVSIDECVAAIAHLLAPDLWSRTKEFQGRRIKEIDGGWIILNYPKYRDMQGSREVSMTPEAIRQRRHRAGVTGVTPRDSTVTDSDPSASASGSESGSEETATTKEPEGRDGLRDYCTRLAVAANKGLGHEIPRILASSGSTLQAVEILSGADIPVAFAERVVFERARTLGVASREVRSLHYFTRMVCEEWEREEMKSQVARSPLGPGEKRKPAKAGDVVAEAVAAMADIRLCPACDRMIGPTAAASHVANKHEGAVVAPFTEWEKA